MLKEKRIVKKILALLMVVAIILPYSSPVFAIALKHTDTSVNLETTPAHEGGDDESGFVTDLIDNYDTNPYTYKIANSGDSGKTTVFKLRKEGDNAFEDVLYCLNAQKSFPSDGAKPYVNKGDLSNTSIAEVNAFKNSIGQGNYNSLLWLIDNMYLRKQKPEEKENYINTAFATEIAKNVIPKETAEHIASILTDDDIEVVQQWAIWYFTNGNRNGYSSDYERYYHAKYSALGTIYVSGMNTDGEKTFRQISSSNGEARQNYAEILFDYLVTTAKTHSSSYSISNEVKATLWLPEDNRVQPVVLITKEVEPEPELKLDLALRKYIVSINGEEVTNRNPNRANHIDTSTITENGGTAQYKHRKDAVVLEPGSNVVFEISVYNEGTLDGTALEITDYLPEGMTLTQNSTINNNNGWEVSDDGRIAKTTALSGETIRAYASTNRLDYKSVQIECTIAENIADNITSAKTLTNIAEITKYSDDEENNHDRDSRPSITDEDRNNPNFRGKTAANVDLSSDNHYYPGLEDDDDFEKIQINPIQDEPELDLALRKYIVSIDGETVSDRTPNRSGHINPSKITETGTAEYKHAKKEKDIRPGSNVVFEISVYNEGTLDGTALEITDYLPEGMTLTQNSTINNNNGWEVSDDGRIAKTTALSGETIRAYTGTNSLDYKSVQIECTVAEDIDEGTILTNIAEITKYSDDEENNHDRDSRPSITDEDRNNSDFRGRTPVNVDLSSDNHYYPGLEDDDDFEKVKITSDPSDPIIDLALRKYIIKVGSETEKYRNRTPVVDPSTINNPLDRTATYKHIKSPVEVEPGTKVVYEIRVYNEGVLDGRALEITDYLPGGLTFVPKEESTINNSYGWEISDDGRIAKTTALSGETIRAYTGSGNLDSKFVQIECMVSADANNLVDSKVLTNVAEITRYSDTDRDSEPSIDPSTITDSWSGNTANDRDLSKTNYHYKGQEDDDDFEKVEIKIKYFDLALKKFITKINGAAPKESREPKVDTTKLKAGTAKDATYTMPKSLLEVNKGDIVTYTIRVYNEGNKSGYAEEISDFLPAGLGYLMNYKGNVENKWTVSQSAKAIKLSEVENGLTKLKAEDFDGTTPLADQTVVIGGGKFTSTKLASSDTSTANLIPAFDGTTLSYKDVEITCIVLSDDSSNNNLRNIAEITKHNDENRNPVPVVDRDSIPNTVDPNDYPEGEKKANGGKTQDDHDYENLVVPGKKYFDLALQKFITKVNNNDIKDREPSVTKNSDGKFRYSHSSEALGVCNNDEITYTLRVYNEGQIDGYAKEVMDDIPSGLEFLPDNNTNKEYEWKMYDKDGKETTDVKQAVRVKTTYLSKEKQNDKRQNLIKAYDPETMKTPDYKDVKLVFKVVEKAAPNKGNNDIINTAEIAANQDPDGKNIDDIDSVPANNKAGEDDIDKEKVNVKYFDLALRKTIAKIIITENGKTREVVPKDGKELLKIEINRKYLATTTVKVVYNITITNEGQIAGYAKEIKDYIPKGLVFNQKENPNWAPVSTDCIRTEALANTLIEPGKNATVQVTLEWDKDQNNLGEKINVAEISKDYNDHGSPDIDSTPDNKKDGEDDIDKVPVILSISTGEEPVYIVLSSTVLTIIATGVALIKKFVLI